MTLVRELRSRNINVRVTESEHARLASEADAHDLTISDWMRRCALGEVPMLGPSDDRLDDMERRLARLESFAAGSGGGW